MVRDTLIIEYTFPVSLVAEATRGATMASEIKEGNNPAPIEKKNTHIVRLKLSQTLGNLFFFDQPATECQLSALANQTTRRQRMH